MADISSKDETLRDKTLIINLPGSPAGFKLTGSETLLSVKTIVFTLGFGVLFFTGLQPAFIIIGAGILGFFCNYE